MRTMRAIFTAALIATPMLINPAAAHADDALNAAINEVCGMGGRSANPWQLNGEKLSLEQRFGLTDAQATSLMWQAINGSCP